MRILSFTRASLDQSASGYASFPFFWDENEKRPLRARTFPNIVSSGFALG